MGLYDNYQAFWHETWRDLVSEYSRTSLKFPGDKLVALSGVVKYFAAKLGLFGDKYLAGL